jgi:3-dehydroquinate synthase
VTPSGTAVVSAVVTVEPQDGTPYDVTIGRGLDTALADAVAGASAVVLVHPEVLHGRARALTASLLASRGGPVLAVAVPDGEPAKALEVAAGLYRRLGEEAIDRRGVIVGLGGGAVTDLAGFVAATWLRGVAVVHVPTTLLGMVDAAVGGKTGIDTDAGKNLVGAFHQPAAVLCDLDALATLPAAEVVSGLGEVAKCGFIADPAILDLLERDPSGSAHIAELVERAVRVKADVVARDTREAGPREMLNYGHTLGHAIERAEHFSWRHGEAISVGMVFAAALGRLTGRLDPVTAARHRELLSGLGLPVAYSGADWPALVEIMRRDKKTRSAGLRFVVLDGLARPGILERPEPAVLAAAFAEVSA